MLGYNCVLILFILVLSVFVDSRHTPRLLSIIFKIPILDIAFERKETSQASAGMIAYANYKRVVHKAVELQETHIPVTYETMFDVASQQDFKAFLYYSCPTGPKSAELAAFAFYSKEYSYSLLQFCLLCRSFARQLLSVKRTAIDRAG
mmetsp:Transcript_24325/g.58708  ORF Transcript_24325/g.58708 Transcript_24325/m.58708 type:complete len:148 (+) Transcript_24325:304-747(+)